MEDMAIYEIGDDQLDAVEGGHEIGETVRFRS